MSEKRNIVLITLDSLRADHCSFMGHHRETTPTIDKMARKGLYFENAIASGVATPVSMFGIFTGDYAPVKYTGKINIIEYSNLWKKELMQRKTLAQVLLIRGYDTLAFNPNPTVSSYLGFNKGFRQFYELLSKSTTHKQNTRKLLSGENKFVVALRTFLKFLRGEEGFLQWEKIYEDIINFVKNAKKPYFLWILLIDTHAPYNPPSESLKWSSSFDKLIGYYNVWKAWQSNWKINFSKKERNKLINLYDDSIRYADKFVSNLWNDLKEDDPILIIHSDHGEAFGEHGFYYHPPILYEELIHVPLVIYNADFKGKIKKPVSLLSLAPSILEIVGEENEFPSESFLNGGRDWVISKVFTGERIRLAIRMEDWKYIVGQKEKDELYYLKKDPHEQENLIDEYPRLAKEMRKIVERHLSYEEEKRKIRERVSGLKRQVNL